MPQVHIPINTGDGSANQLEFWNPPTPAHPDRPDSIEGTIVEIDVIQTMMWNGKQQVPQFFDDGNPKKSIRIIIMNAVNGIDTAVEFKMNRNSGIMLAIAQSCPNISGIEELGGHYVRITSPNGYYSQQNARPYTFTDFGLSNIPFRGVFDKLPQRQPQPQVAPPMQGGMYAAPQVQQPQQQHYNYAPGGYPAQPAQPIQPVMPQQQIQQQPMQQPAQPQQQVMQQIPQQQVISQQAPQQTMPQQQVPQQQVAQQAPVPQAPQQGGPVDMNDIVEQATASQIYNEQIPF